VSGGRGASRSLLKRPACPRRPAPPYSGARSRGRIVGRQIAVVATETDERALLAFVRSVAPIRILIRAAKTADELWVPDFAPFSPVHGMYYLWNAAFPWTPDLQPGEGCVFVRDIATAPVIEFSRTDTDRVLQSGNIASLAVGRIYWARQHMADALAYDVAAFGKWYDQVVRWVRKSGHRIPGNARSPYFLPNAWDRWQGRRSADQ